MSEFENDGPAPAPPSTETPSNPFQDEVNDTRRQNDHHHMQPFPQAGEYVPPVASINVSPPGRVAGLPEVDIVDTQQQTTRMGSGSDSSHPGPWNTPRRNPPETTLSVGGNSRIVPSIQLSMEPDKK